MKTSFHNVGQTFEVLLMSSRTIFTITGRTLIFLQLMLEAFLHNLNGYLLIILTGKQTRSPEFMQGVKTSEFTRSW